MAKLQIQKKGKKSKKSNKWWWIILIGALVIIGIIILIIVLATGGLKGGGNGGKNGPQPPVGPAGSPDDTDCLALQYYGGADKGARAPRKICGVFDGFSHWSWNGMKRWLAYFRKQTGAKNVIIYEAQFLPKSWFAEVGAKIVGTDNTTIGIKDAAKLLPNFCSSDSDCGGGPHEKCNNGICINTCLTAAPDSCTQADLSKCNTQYAGCAGCANGSCPVYCNNGACKYTPPKGPACSYCKTDVDCKEPGSYCKNDPTKSPPFCCSSSTVENFEDSNSLLCPFNTGTSCSSVPNSMTSATGQTKASQWFVRNMVAENAYWGQDSKTQKWRLQGIKGGMGGAFCPYGAWFDPDKQECIEHIATCKGGESMMGVCGVKASPKCSSKCTSGEVCVETDSGAECLPLPEITLTWYAFVGKAQIDETVAKNYVQSIINFCHKAGIKRLMFPMIVPDKNNTPFLGGEPSTAYPQGDYTVAQKWIEDNVIGPANKVSPPIDIGLNVYASYKDSRWQQWLTGKGGAQCSATGTDPGCEKYSTKGACSKVSECAWEPGDDTHASQCVRIDGSCSWPFILKFASRIAGIGKYLQVDQEWCNCGDLKAAAALCASNKPPFILTMAGSLGGASGLGGVDVPEVYWDAGNQFPCTGGAGTYDYLTPACTSWGIHRKLKDQPKAFYDLIAGGAGHAGSDLNPDSTSKQNIWLGRGKFKAMTDALPSDNIWPSFSIENLSMCSGDMVLKGASDKGGGRWVCSSSK